MEYSVTFRHPTTGATLTAQINPDLTADEVISALVAENFITAPDSTHGYALAVKGGEMAQGSQTLGFCGLTEGATITLLNQDVAG